MGAATISEMNRSRNSAEPRSFFNIHHDEHKDGLVLLDMTGKILQINTTVERLFGISSAEVLNQSIDVLVSELAGREPGISFQEHLANRRNMTLRHGYGVTCLRGDGTRFYCDLGFMETRIDGIQYVVCIVSDITLRQSAEEELKRKQISQELTNNLLKLFMQDGGLDQLLNEALDQILGVPWLSTVGAGCVFLLDGNTGALTMKANRNLPEGVAQQCAQIPVGERICGHAANSQKTRIFMVNEKCSCRSQKKRCTIISDNLADALDTSVSNEHSVYYCGLPVYDKDELLALVLIYLSSDYQYENGDNDLFESITSTLAGGIKLKQSEENLLQLLTNNRLLTKTLIRAQEEERRILARELHDEMGQSLTAVRAEATIIANRTEEKIPYLHQSAKSILRVADQLYDVTHTIMTRLRPSTLDELGLVAAISNHIEKWSKAHPWVNCEMDFSGELNNLTEDINITLYRVIQEGLSNVIQHATATDVTVSLFREQYGDNIIPNKKDRLFVAIEDNGRGLRHDHRQHIRGHLGLQGIQERIEGLGGEFRLTSERGKGLRLEGWIPLIEHESKVFSH